MDRPFTPELTARFAADLARVWPEGGRLGLAVSGGPDSLAMLLLAHAATPGTVEAATVNHGLRSDAADEAAMVALVCADLGVPHETLSVQVAPGNLQASARIARYAALDAWLTRRALDALATAHHADDQAETLVMRLNRGSGLAGLAGIRARGCVIGSNRPLLRPLLGWRQADLAAVVSHAGLQAAADPSNADDRFDRVRVRRAMTGADWLDPLALASSAANLAEADDAMEWAAACEWDAQVKKTNDAIVYRPSAPRALRLRVLERAIRETAGNEPRGGEVAALHDRLLAGSAKATLGGTLIELQQGTWTIKREPARG